jgi:hypothetical protein
MAIDVLSFARAIAAGQIRVVDLTQTLSQDFPTIVLPPELGQCAPFRIEEVSPDPLDLRQGFAEQRR